MTSTALTRAPVSLSSLSQPFIKGCVYGGPSSGKTIFACSSQKMVTFVFDVDDGTISAKAWAQRHNLNTDWCHVWKVATYADFVAGFDYLVRNLKTYQLAVVDTSTELQQIMLDELRHNAGIDVASKREWGIVFTMMEHAIRQFRHLPLHVLWTAHESEKENEQFHRVMYQAAFQGQFGGPHWPKHFSEIWRYCLFEQQVKIEGADNRIQTVTHRKLQCQRDQFTVAKDRSMGLDQYEDPNIDYIFDKMIYSIVNKGITLDEGE
jgi:hypothetical protein